MLSLRRPNKLILSSLVRAASTVSPSPNRARVVVPDFSNGQEVHKHTSTFELARALVVLRLCGVKALVDNAPLLLRWGEKVLGRRGLSAILKATFFGHFCAGEDQESIRPKVTAFEKAGVGSILDYAAEADEHALVAAPLGAGHDEEALVSVTPAMPVSRTYHYVGEEGCDEHVEVFKDCIEAVHAVSPTGFAAIKVTALGPPELLKRMSTALVEVRRLFEKFDDDADGVITIEEFKNGYRRYFVDDADESGAQELERLLLATTRKELPTLLIDGGVECVDYVEWSNNLELDHLTQLTDFCRNKGALYQAVLDGPELEAYRNLEERLETLADLAAKRDVRLMVDAEQTYFQPAIDHLVYRLQQRHNRVHDEGSELVVGPDGVTKVPPKPRCIIFSTYQCYLTETKKKLATDLERAKRYKYNFGAKLVRGAYMVSERERAATCGYEDPVLPNLEATHESYNAAIDQCLEVMAGEAREVKQRGGLGRTTRTEVMIASHNQDSVEHVLHRMGDLDLDVGGVGGGGGGNDNGGGEDGGNGNGSGIADVLETRFSLKPRVYFGQLQGMSDHLTFLLGGAGYRAYKYVPFGPVHEVVPYLLRRAQENSTLLGEQSSGEVVMLQTELKRRLLTTVGLSK